ncbi:MAG: AbrB/MazE/SpoVT family DNA-binding domain-containing protein [Leptolyngbya sp. Prado105]|jgi:AbrB family looped-hinge helix DNA binding protein|nr:AbrB/MazE/SpoVT family DNA-binding domain-containing protein [Leptolyngbya sp. Prado105]
MTIPPQPIQPVELELGENGTLVLPEAIRHQLNLQSGDRLILTVDPNGTLHLTNVQTQIQKLQGIFKDIAPGVSLADELIRDRQREAQTEN